MKKFLALILALIMTAAPVLAEDEEELSLEDILQGANPGVVSETITGAPEEPADLLVEEVPEEPEIVYEADGSVIISRWDKNGLHNLKSRGVRNTVLQDTFNPDRTVYESSRIVTATDDRYYEE